LTSQPYNPLVSIITPTYNHQGFIAACIDSALGQSYSNWEQIIVDDGSTDGTGAIVRRYQDARIRYERQTNQGPFALASTYNRALSLARGELVAILEGDDMWPPGKLELLVPAFLDESLVLAYGEAVDIDARNRAQRRESRTARRRKVLSGAILSNDPIGSATRHMLTAEGRSLVSPSTVLLRRSALDAIGGFKQVSGLPLTDYPTFINLSLKGRFQYSSRTLGYRRRHGMSVTVNYARTIHENVSKFTRAFLADNTDQIPLSAEEMKTIEADWRESEHRLHLAEGRVLLLRKMWPEAQRQFRAAWESKNLILRAIAAVGLVCSWLHSDLECLTTLCGRYSLQVQEANSSKTSA